MEGGAGQGAQQPGLSPGPTARLAQRRGGCVAASRAQRTPRVCKPAAGPWSLGSPAGPGINSLVIGPGGVGLQDALWDRSGTPRFVGSGDGAPWALREGVICQPFHWVITPDGRTVLRGYAGENLIPFFVYIFQSSDS